MTKPRPVVQIIVIRYPLVLQRMPKAPATRCRSAPPVCLKDVGSVFFLRNNEPADLFMDLSHLTKFASITTVGRTHARVVMIVDGDKILKLYPHLVDVSVVVANMNLARTKVPVPHVYDYGYSGNCAYILMERVMNALTAQDYIEMQGCALPRRLGARVKRIVADLASVGLSHNDLYPRNVMVDRFWAVKSVIDWDDCTGSEVAGEYARRIGLRWEMHDWDYLFLKHSSDRTGEIFLSGEGPTAIPRRPPLARYPLGRNIGPIQRAQGIFGSSVQPDSS